METLLPALGVFLVLLLMIVFFLGSAVGFAKRLLGPKLQDHPTCGYCGYIIMGMTASTCPECGCDLQVAGVRPPKSHATGDSWIDFLPTIGFYKQAMGPLLIYTLALTFLTLAAALLISHEVWPSHKNTRLNIAAQPLSRGYRSVAIHVADRKNVRGNPANHHGLSDSRTARVELQTDTGLHTLEIDLIGRSYSYTDTNRQTTAASKLPAKDDLILFMQSAGVIVDRDAAAEAAAIARFVSALESQPELLRMPLNLISDPSLQVSRFDTYNSGWEEPLPLVLVALVAWAGLWLLGIVVILWKRRHTLGPPPRAFTAQPQTL